MSNIALSVNDPETGFHHCICSTTLFQWDPQRICR